MAKYLITGGTGFIGRHLVDYLLHDGIKPEDIRLLITSRKKLKNLSKNSYEVIVGDVRNKKQVENAVKGVDVIYHLATKAGVGDGSYRYFKDTNVEGTRNLVDAAVKNKAKKFIFFSSVGVYGFPALAGDIRNVSESYKRTFNEGYGQTKVEAEDLIIKACAGSAMKYIIIRPTLVFGPGRKDSFIQLISAIKKHYFFYIGNGNNRMDYVYVKDVVRISRELEISKISNEDFIVGSGNPLTQKRIVETISDVAGSKRPWIFIPKNIALFVSYIIYYLSKLIGFKPFLFPDRFKVLTSYFYFNTGKLKRYGFKPKYTFKEGLKETILYLNFNE